MVLKGKRRSSQRGRGSKGVVNSTGGPRSKENTPLTPPLGKKRRVVISSQAARPPNERSTRRTVQSEDPKLIDQDFQTSPGIREADGAPTVPRKRTPPSREQSQFNEARRSRNTPEQQVVHENRLRTADTIPEESGSDDRDVYPVRREPLEEMAFYQRYVVGEHDDENIIPNLFIRMFSPVSPANADNTSPASGRRDEGGDGCSRGIRDSGSRELSGRQVYDDEPTARLSVTRELLSSFHCAIEQKFVSEMKLLQNFMSDKFRGLELLEGNLTQQLNELRFVSSSGRGASSSQCRPTPLSKYESKLDLETPHGEWVFNTYTICKILRFNLCMFVVDLANQDGETLDNISLAIRALLFGLLPSQKRVAFSNGVGLRHSSFRFTVVLNVLFNVQQNVFKRFLLPYLSGDGDSAEVVNVDNHNTEGARVAALDSTVMQIAQPKWLKSGFILKRHVEEARSRVESNTTGSDSIGDEPVATGRTRKPWLTVKDTPDRGDIARYGALKVYRSVTTGLYQAREKAR